ncbi:MAG: RNA methyltransferase, partial [Bacteroidales bacterium]|nr:RNA methyltransferase [Bacteroidales bacterium]
KTKNSELGRISIEEFKKTKKTPVTIILDNIRSLNNIGSVFRTADAFLIEEIHLCGITAIPPNKDIQKTALGATESVSWKYFEDTFDSISYLKNNSYSIIAIEQADDSIYLDKFYPEKGKKLAIIFGHEVKGIDKKIMNMVDTCIEIPQFGTKHSINISVCTGIVIWDIFSKLSKL